MLLKKTALRDAASSMNSSINNKVTVRYSANVHDDTSYISARHVSGQMRKELYEKLKHMNPSTYHHEELNEMESDVYASGNRDSSTANVDVLRKIKSELYHAKTEMLC